MTYTLWRRGEQVGETVGTPRINETGELVAELKWCADFATNGIFMQCQEPAALGGRCVQTQSLNGVESYADMDAPRGNLLELRTDTGAWCTANLIVTNVYPAETNAIGQRFQFSTSAVHWQIHALPNAFRE